MPVPFVKVKRIPFWKMIYYSRWHGGGWGWGASQDMAMSTQIKPKPQWGHGWKVDITKIRRSQNGLLPWNLMIINKSGFWNGQFQNMTATWQKKVWSFPTVSLKFESESCFTWWPRQDPSKTNNCAPVSLSFQPFWLTSWHGTSGKMMSELSRKPLNFWAGNNLATYSFWLVHVGTPYLAVHLVTSTWHKLHVFLLTSPSASKPPKSTPFSLGIWRFRSLTQLHKAVSS